MCGYSESVVICKVMVGKEKVIYFTAIIPIEISGPITVHKNVNSQSLLVQFWVAIILLGRLSIFPRTAQRFVGRLAIEQSHYLINTLGYQRRRGSIRISKFIQITRNKAVTQPTSQSAEEPTRRLLWPSRPGHHGLINFSSHLLRLSLNLNRRGGNGRRWFFDFFALRFDLVRSSLIVSRCCAFSVVDQELIISQTWEDTLIVSPLGNLLLLLFYVR